MRYTYKYCLRHRLVQYYLLSSVRLTITAAAETPLKRWPPLPLNLPLSLPLNLPLALSRSLTPAQFNSREPCVSGANCGHAMHQKCHNEFLKSGNNKCPTCFKVRELAQEQQQQELQLHLLGSVLPPLDPTLSLSLLNSTTSIRHHPIVPPLRHLNYPPPPLPLPLSPSSILCRPLRSRDE